MQWSLIEKLHRISSYITSGVSAGAQRLTSGRHHDTGQRQTRRSPGSARGHAFVLKLLDRVLVLRQMGEPHAAQHVRRLGELNVVVADDLEAVAPGIAEIEEPARQRLDARRRQRAADRVLVIDHETEMTAIIGGLGAALLQRDELIAQIDERRGLALAAQFELEQAAVEGERLLDIADLESDVVETDGARFPWLWHGGSPTIRGSHHVVLQGHNRFIADAAIA